MNDNKILYTREKNRCFIKLQGDIHHPLSSGFDAVINKMLSCSEIETYIIDLRETLYIDSTNLGLMAKIARFTQERQNIKPIIISINTEINVVLESMGFESVFTIIENYGQTCSGFRETPNVTSDEHNKALLILEAHKTLLEMNDKCKSMFKNVVELLEREISLTERTNPTSFL